MIHGHEEDVREPAVAGSFYPSEPKQINRILDEWLRTATAARCAWRAALVPHAGWVYSGRIAADVFSRIEFPRTVVLICPKHRAGGATWAVAPWKRWRFPGGELESDVELSCQLAAEVPLWELDPRPHLAEHAIEVQLPLIARLAPTTRIVAITMGRTGLDQCEHMAAAMADVLRDQIRSTLLVISSDMNHFAQDDENRRLDELALQALDALDPDLLFATCRQHRISMCGMVPAVLILKILKHLHAVDRSQRVAYATSADAGGDRQRVVGYAGLLFD